MDDTVGVRQKLVEAARPYGFAAEFPRELLLPDLVFYRPDGGAEVARFRYVEPPEGSPFLHSIIPAYVSAEEQRDVEQHLATHVTPVIVRDLSFRLWVTLADD